VSMIWKKETNPMYCQAKSMLTVQTLDDGESAGKRGSSLAAGYCQYNADSSVILRILYRSQR